MKWTSTVVSLDEAFEEEPCLEMSSFQCLKCLYPKHIIILFEYIEKDIASREENETFFIKVWKPLSSRHVLKTLRGSLKGKVQRGQYLLAVGLGGY